MSWTIIGVFQSNFDVKQYTLMFPHCVPKTPRRKRPTFYDVILEYDGKPSMYIVLHQSYFGTIFLYTHFSWKYNEKL